MRAHEAGTKWEAIYCSFPAVRITPASAYAHLSFSTIYYPPPLFMCLWKGVTLIK